MDKQVGLAVLIDGVEDLGQVVGDAVAGRDLDYLRVVLKFLGHATDVVREGGREQQRLALRGEKSGNLAHIGHEAHVEHPVALVEDEDLDLAEVDRALANVVEEAARRRDEDLDASPKELDLGVDAGAAVDDGGAKRNAAAVCLDGLGDLHRELAGGGQDEDADRVSGRREAGVGGASQALQDRQDECCGLAGTGLGGGENVAAGEDVGDRRALNGRWFGVALARHCREEVGR